MASRAQPTLFSEWWRTVDRLTLAALFALMLGGIVLCLAARHNTMPPSISAPRAASVSRSTVHHHSENNVGCAREAITSPGQAAVSSRD